MKLTEGQLQAREELEAIALESDSAFSVDRIHNPTEDKPGLLIEFSLRLGPIGYRAGGLVFRENESFLAVVPANFPFERPSICVLHQRFAGFPHVQWSRSLCLYQTAVEWNASDGMFGLIDRLQEWVTNASMNNLDPEEGPLHPPAIYTNSAATPRIVIRSNSPCAAGEYWAGFGIIQDNSSCMTISGWVTMDEPLPNTDFVVTVIVPKALPWEFPTTGSALTEEIQKQGGSKDWLLALLTLAALRMKAGEPALLLIGTPMRRDTGGTPRIHFAAWQIPAETVDHLKAAFPDSSDCDEVVKIKKRMGELTLKIFETSPIDWCHVLEDRDEIVIRRDDDSAAKAWRDKRIMILGCGALGSAIAEMLCRAGCGSLVLLDYDIVTPGILVRQNFIYEDIGTKKVDALKMRLNLIRPDLSIEAQPIEAYHVLHRGSIDPPPDLVFDTTASNILHQRLEKDWPAIPARAFNYYAMKIDGDAKSLLGVAIPPASCVGPWSAFRDLKLELCRKYGVNGIFSKYHRKIGEKPPFQPEPGCSEPTFVGSGTDLSLLASTALNTFSDLGWKENQESPFYLAFEQPQACKPVIFHLSTSAKYKRFPSGGYDICLSTTALSEIFSNIRKNSRKQSENTETGGLLWGEWDHASKLLWVNDASDAPPDSVRSPQIFICGTVGTMEEHERRIKDSLDGCGFVGMWHTHPVSPPDQSRVDIHGMLDMLLMQQHCPRRLLLLILGRENDETLLGSYLYRRRSSVKFEEIEISPAVISLGSQRWK